MTDNNKKLKNFLNKELGSFFTEKNISNYSITLNESLDLFFNVLEFKLKDKSLDGVSNIIHKAISEYSDEGMNTDSILQLSIGLEAYLKKITKLAVPGKYEEIQIWEKKGKHTLLLHMLFYYLKLKKSDRNIYYVEDPSIPIKTDDKMTDKNL